MLVPIASGSEARYEKTNCAKLREWKGFEEADTGFFYPFLLRPGRFEWLRFDDLPVFE